jgi:hypothetical protein
MVGQRQHALAVWFRQKREQPLGIFPYAINQARTITGNYFNTNTPSGGRYSGFLLSQPPNGTFTTFDPLGSTGTTPTAIDSAGETTGNYSDVNGTIHGFLRSPSYWLLAINRIN